jgi:hypothetical protein
MTRPTTVYLLFASLAAVTCDDPAASNLMPEPEPEVECLGYGVELTVRDSISGYPVIPFTAGATAGEYAAPVIFDVDGEMATGITGSGVYHVYVEADGYEGWSRYVDIGRAECGLVTQRITAKLVRLPAPVTWNLEATAVDLAEGRADTVVLTALDSAGNPTPFPVTWTVRDSAVGELFDYFRTGTVYGSTVGTTWVVAATRGETDWAIQNAAVDSVQVTVLPAPPLAVGEAMIVTTSPRIRRYRVPIGAVVRTDASTSSPYLAVDAPPGWYHEPEEIMERVCIHVPDFVLEPGVITLGPPGGTRWCLPGTGVAPQAGGTAAVFIQTGWHWLYGPVGPHLRMYRTEDASTLSLDSIQRPADAAPILYGRLTLTDAVEYAFEYADLSSWVVDTGERSDVRVDFVVEVRSESASAALLSPPAPAPPPRTTRRRSPRRRSRSPRRDGPGGPGAAGSGPPPGGGGRACRRRRAARGGGGRRPRS